MSNDYVVFVRGEGGKLVLLEPDELEIRFYQCSGHDGIEVHYVVGGGRWQETKAVRYSSLDMTKPVPDEVDAVVCRTVTEELCEGEWVSLDNEPDNIWLVKWSDIDRGFYLAWDEEALAQRFSDNEPEEIKQLGHRLTHEIVDGEVKAI